uniref:Dol-P-Glc:Glc(2)Man(9)GlcNAc(2)-PP-Dol alpha-1,2-glucosyltransferase n=1 Tax=Hydra vulgaris TaxID=6087 RepID=T2MC99_HYDVU
MEELLFKRGIISLIFSVPTALIFIAVNKNEPNPYMDEIFHIPQAGNFCHGNFTHWDNKITTLPGIYILSQTILSIIAFLSNKSLVELCNVQWLRFTNVIFALCCFFVLKEIILVLNISNTSAPPRADKNKIASDDKKSNSNNAMQKSLSKDFGIKSDAMALTLLNFPLLYFFSFFYYTDVGSTCFVLLSYLLSLKNYHFFSAVSGTLAILFRQTNVVWIFFVFANSCLEFLSAQNSTESNDRGLLQALFDVILGGLNNFWKLLLKFYPYLSVFVGFVVFVYKNNGLVVGDRTNHEVSLNFPQVLYFSIFVMFFSCHLLTRYKQFIVSIKKINIWFCILTFIVMFLMVHHFTMAHRYLLADNRHYTFYVWRKIINRSWYSRYMLIPAYFISWMIMYNEMSKSNKKLWVFLFILCTSVVLIPQKLLEFRYYIVPYILFKLHLPLSSFKEIALEYFMYLLVNGFTFYMFLFKPFSWVDHSLQRFMW